MSGAGLTCSLCCCGRPNVCCYIPNVTLFHTQFNTFDQDPYQKLSTIQAREQGAICGIAVLLRQATGGREACAGSTSMVLEHIHYHDSSFRGQALQWVSVCKLENTMSSFLGLLESVSLAIAIHEQTQRNGVHKYLILMCCTLTSHCEIKNKLDKECILTLPSTDKQMVLFLLYFFFEGYILNNKV